MTNENIENTTNNLDDTNEPIIVNLDQDTYDALIEIYVKDNFVKESIEVFNDYCAAGESAVQALSRGVINEMVIKTLTDQLARGEFAENLKENHNKE